VAASAELIQSIVEQGYDAFDIATAHSSSTAWPDGYAYDNLIFIRAPLG